ncbi:MAG: tRNA (adenosine(37)-N6)-threonylcarbamoyltransferase complex dimerization subunit type 1 TsaB [Chthoniobacterales bacterium]
MRVLALELSSARGSIAFRDGDDEIFASEFANDRKHSGIFFTDLKRCVDQSGDAEKIVVGLGPGSYAGTRIAIAAAIGLKAATGAQLGGLPSIIALPTDAPDYVVIGDARRQSFFFALVRQRCCSDGPVLCSAEELDARLRENILPVFATEPILQFPAATVLHPSASILVRIPSAVTAAPLEPIYLREPHITQPKTARV